MGYVKAIYKDELDQFIENFKDLVEKEALKDLNKKDALLFLEFFQTYLDQTISVVSIKDLRKVPTSL
jgi:hypothetical protein